MANNKKNENKHLYYLNELDDYKVASDDPDIRGWEVKDADNRVVGKVDNLLVSKEREKVVYVDVEVDQSIIEANHDPYSRPSSEGVHEFINKEGENHLIVPIGLVKLNEDEKYVYTDRINHQTFAETKRMEKGSNVNREYEVAVLESYDRDQDYRETTDERTTLTDDEAIAREKRRTEGSAGDVSRRSETEGRTEEAGTRGRNEGSPEDVSRKGRIPDDDSLYDRREFDEENYRRRRRE